MSHQGLISPEEVLGVARGADEQEVRRAYLAKVREFPPDQAPEQFQLISEAYELLKDPRILLGMKMSQAAAREFPMELLEERKDRFRFAGMNAWLKAMKAP